MKVGEVYYRKCTVIGLTETQSGEYSPVLEIDCELIPSPIAKIEEQLFCEEYLPTEFSKGRYSAFKLVLKWLKGE